MMVMPVEAFIINIFYWVKDLYNMVVTRPIHRRGTQACDSKVIAKELADQWLDHPIDKAIYRCFKKVLDALVP